MSQHDINIANQGFPAFRADLNSALAALVSNNSGASAPATTFANMPWYDTTNNIFKLRNADNDAWISVFTLNQTTDAITAIGSVTLADLATIAASQAEMEAGTQAAIRTMSPLRVAQAIAALGVTSIRGLFRKADATIVAFTKTGAGTATTSSIIYVDVNGSIKTIASGTSITMPTLAAGTDYAIWAKTDGTLEATSNHTSPPTANARKIGGFHYAAGSNSTGTSGGNTTPQINEYSFWDLKWRPACNDPRGMTLVADGFWVDMFSFLVPIKK